MGSSLRPQCPQACVPSLKHFREEAGCDLDQLSEPCFLFEQQTEAPEEEIVAEETVAEDTGVRMWCVGGDPTPDPLLPGPFLGPSRQGQWGSSLEWSIYLPLVCTQGPDINWIIPRHSRLFPKLSVEPQGWEDSEMFGLHISSIIIHSLPVVKREPHSWAW